MLFFTLATLLPAGLLTLGALGQVWAIWAAILYISVFTWVLDRLVHRGAVRMRDGAEFPGGDGLLMLLATLIPVMMGLAIWAVGGAPGLGPLQKVGVIIGHGLYFGQVGHPAAHELIHRPARLKRAMGRAIYIVILMGQHASSHLRVHHLHVGLPSDPASAPRGLGFWRYAPRALAGSFRAGWSAETALRKRASAGASGPHPYAWYLGGAALVILIGLAIAGPGGLLALLAIAGYAQIQVLLSDYVQHYGLRRGLADNGKPEPVAPEHSWNAPHFGSSAMMLNAPRHSDHHQNPARPYPALRLEPNMPVLPYSVPVMAVVALFPPLWRKIMDRRLDALQHAPPGGR